MRKKRNRKLVIFSCSFTIWLLMTALWAFIWYSCYAGLIDLPYYRRGNWVVVAIYGVLLYLITHFYGGYRIGYARRGDLIFSGILSMVVTNGITYLQTSLIGRDFMPVRPFLWMTAIQFVLIWIWATSSVKLYLRLNPPRHLLMIYGGSSAAQSLIPKIAERDDKYIIQEALNIEHGLTDVFERIDQFRAVLICDVKSTHRNRLLKYCYSRGIRVYMTPKISDILIRGSRDISLFDSPLLLSRNEGFSPEQQAVKRVADVVVAAIGLVATSPLMLLTALAIKLEDQGPVIYSQERLTQDGQIFLLHKFRSMIVNAEKETGARLAGKVDNRITRVGGVIRRIRFDELPQLVNILKGEMSLVGPRPERPEIAEQYKKNMPEFDFRLKVKAGLTGYAQVIGKYNTTPYDKLKMDLMYIANYSAMMDLKLVLQTVKILFIKESSEGTSELVFPLDNQD